MNRFYVDLENIDLQRKMVRIGDEEARHILKVLRFESGDEIIAFDGHGSEYRLELLRAGQRVLGRIIEISRPEREASHRVILVQSLAKADKMDAIVQKAVEIGIAEIFPVITRHSVIRLEEGKRGSKAQRWQVIAREACKQSRRTVIPTVHPVMSLADFWDTLPTGDTGCQVVIAYEKGAPDSLRQYLTALKNSDPGLVYLLIGPEGGFDPLEIELAARHNAATVSLGPRILRTETAGLVLASLVLYELGDLD